MRSMLKILTLFFITPVFIHSGYQEGEAIFIKKCTACHARHIPASQIKENFFEKNNTLLKLKAPSVNMLAYAIMDSALHIGDANDPEMQQVEIEEFLMDYLYNPKLENSICDKNIAKHYEVKPSMKGKVSPKEIADIATYFMGYKKARQKTHPKKKRVLSQSYNETDLLKDAIKENKRIIIEASSSTCHFCKEMKEKVLEDSTVQANMQKDFILIEIDVDKVKLPFGLKKSFMGVTPSFFFLSKEGKLLNSYPGSWDKHNWDIILNENRKRK